MLVISSTTPSLSIDALYEYFVAELKRAGISRVETGKFGADMKVSLINDGPVTIILDSEELK